jgi:crotonobetainyl-CoA:carnitine CoA-transferase CaiB-like acyl-CoA transferase
MTGALAGLKVLDLKVEPPAGDETRGWGPPHAGGEAAYYLGVNRNKRGMVLDLSTGEGREILAALLRQSDVLVENYKTGTLDKWGFGAQWRSAECPRLVHCSITGYGTTGPNADLPGYDFILQAESGLMSITGPVDGAPTKHGVAIVDLATGMLATIAILGALNARAASGRGQTVSVSLFESGLALLANVASNHLVSGKPARRYGNGHPNIVPYGTFRAADGDLALAIGNDAQFARFAGIAGHPQWTSDPRFATNAARVVNREVIEQLVDAAVAGRPIAWWIEHLRAANIACGAVNSVEAALADAQTAARDMVLSIAHPTAEGLRTLGFPFKMTGTPPAATRPPPRLGEHTDEVLAELRYDAPARRRLAEAGVVKALTMDAEP